MCFNIYIRNQVFIRLKSASNRLLHLSIIVVLMLTHACTHDPFPPKIEPIQSNDSIDIQDPADTNTVDTTSVDTTISDTTINDTTDTLDVCGHVSVSLSADVIPLISGAPYFCSSCHGSGSNTGVVLINYAGIKSAAESGALMGSIRREIGFQPMPQGAAKMDSCDIELIQVWIDEGMLDN